MNLSVGIMEESKINKIKGFWNPGHYQLIECDTHLMTTSRIPATTITFPLHQRHIIACNFNFFPTQYNTSLRRMEKVFF